jgi:hypothetical protein
LSTPSAEEDSPYTGPPALNFLRGGLMIHAAGDCLAVYVIIIIINIKVSVLRSPRQVGVDTPADLIGE